MAILQWSSALSVGVEEIDAQHQQLISHINALVRAMEKGQGRSEVSQTLQFLQDYVVTHFGAEEKIMRQSVYPAYAVHKAQHDAFVRDFKPLRQKLEKEGATAALVIQVQHQVCDWTVNHVCQTDKKLGQFLIARKVQA